MDTIRVGVAGLGGRGLHWIRLIQRLEGFRITALCDLYQAPLEAALPLVESPDAVICTRRFEDLLADDRVDAVALVLRCEEQGALAAAALSAGKHVHAEVPAAHRMEDCWRLVAAAERSGKVYHLAEQVRHAGYLARWRELVAAGRLGEITYAEGQYLHYYVDKMFRDPGTGTMFGPGRLDEHPGAEPTWIQRMPPIHYLVHDLSPLLYVLDDRVVEVVGMGTPPPGRAHPELAHSDFQAALMRTARGAILRLACSFSQPHPPRETHWQQIIGTAGCVEWRRAPDDRPRLWLAADGDDAKVEVDWGYEREDEPEEARGSGHANLDYYVHAAFRDAVLGRRPLEFDVYQAVDTAAPGIVAAESIARGGRLLPVPDFRPGPDRPAGSLPQGVTEVAR